jgi:uncharacterized repeat protein (TIGR01451 family)
MLTLFSPTASAQDAVMQRADIQSGIQRLKSDTGGAAMVSTNPATGAARFVRLSSGSESSLSRGMTGSPAEKSIAFFKNYGSAFGISNPSSQLLAAGQVSDATGGQHLTYKQVYMNVPVFAGIIKTHFDAKGELRSVNGNFIPDIAVNATPSREASDVASIAIERVKAGIADDNANPEMIAKSTEGLSVLQSTLYIFRENLTLRIPGANHLAYQMEVGNRANVREFVYVDAHTGKVVGQYTGVYDSLTRRAFDGQGSTSVPPPNYPGNPFWVENQMPFPTGNAEADNMITSSKEVYDYYKNAYGRDSFDGNGATMDAIFNRGNSCPNASWNGLFISFCPGLTTDDVTAHEWSHAYTEYTHGLIYAHQSGALNEAYSDIHGETVDQINGRGGDSPNTTRTAGFCSSLMAAAPITRINSPMDVAADYPSGTSAFSPSPVEPGVTSDLVRPNDGATGAGSTLTDGCSNAANFIDVVGGSWTNKTAVAGHVVLIDRGLCGFQIKALNAQRNGASGVIIANVSTSSSPNTAPNMGASAVPAGTEAITIPVLSMSNPNGNLLRAKLDVAMPTTVNGTLKPRDSENSVRWLLGEDDTNPQLFGALRDMWNPTCAGNPGKVSDIQYSCAATPSSANDQGGVHNNSGVINHEYALIVDGGTYNGQTITGIGLTKAAHIFFRAQNLYQTPSSDFADHGDAIEQAAQDLINAATNLPKLTDGTPSGEVVTAADLAEIQKAELAVQLRTVPAACTATPLLNQNTPADTCGANTNPAVIFADDFEGNTAGWTATHVGNTAGFTPRDWAVTSTLPDGRAGKGFFGPDPGTGACIGNSNEAGIIHLTSPSIHIPSTATNRTLRFEHWVSLERGFDGGQLRVSTDGGSTFTLVPQANYTFNAPNFTLPAGASLFDNPMAGQRAFSGSDGFTTDGSWATSIVDLGALAPAGSDIVLRWSVGTDCASGYVGWYLDNVKLSSCLTNTDLSIIKKASATSTLIGNNVTYTYTVKNNGPTNATSVKITDPLPVGLEFVSSPDGCTAVNSVVTCLIGDLTNGATAVRHMVAKTTKIGTIVNTASLTQFEPDTVVPGNNSGGASVNVLQALRSLTFTPTSVIGGCAGSTGKILLNAAAPAGGLDVGLVSSDPDLQIVGANPVHFNQGETQKTFTVTTSSVNAVKTVSVAAKVVGTTTQVIGRLKITPVPIVSVTFNPNPVTGGNQTTGTVTLSCAAPYDISVTLLSNKAAAKPQTPITILQGQTSAPFTVNTVHVLSQTAVTITAKGNGSTKAATLTVIP